MNRAPSFLMLDCPGTNRRLAFGLRWLALIGSDVPALARARGRRLRATHLVVGGSPATMAGFGRVRSTWRPGLQGRWPRRGRVGPVQSAAQLYALLYPAGGHCLIPLPDGRHWLVAAQDGMVLSQSDRLFASCEDALHAQTRLQDQRPGMPEHDANLVWAALLQAVDPAARLAPLPSRWNELPLVLRLFIACVALSAAVPPIATRLTAQRAVTEPLEAPQAAAPTDPGAVSQAMLADLAAHASSELSNLLRGVGRLPIQVQGWALRRAHCNAGADGWECAATYARAHPQASNQRLHAQLPAGWRLSFKPLEEATLHWRMSSTRVPLADVALPTALRVDTELVGELQRMLPAFASVTLAPAVAMPLPGAAGLESVSATPSAYPLIRRRTLRMHGPLRSFALLPGPIEAVRWSYLALQVQAQHRPTLAASTLVAELHGDLYEQD